MTSVEQEYSRTPLADGTHYPPIEKTALLTRMPDGSIRTKEKLPLPVNEFGIPNLDAIIDQSLETIAYDYKFPEPYNRHHLASLARQYHEHPSGSKIPGMYRESGSLLTRVPIQLHNYWHEIFEDSVLPTMDVMTQAAKEQTQINTLAFIGSSAIQLTNATYLGYRDIEVRNTRIQVAKQDAAQMEGIFYDLLDSYQDGQVGILPDRELLASLPFEHAVRELCQYTMPRGIDIRERVRTRLAQIGFRPS